MDTAVSFLIDTGATESFISTQLFQRTDPKLRPTLRHADRGFRQADGSELRVAGRVKLPIKIGGSAILHDVWVADVSDDVILGLDFLRENKCQLLWEDECLTVGNFKVPLQKYPQEAAVCRVRVTEDVVVPPSSELLMECQVVSDGGDQPVWGVLQNREAVARDREVLVASALVHAQNNRVPVRLLNLSPEAVVLRKGTDAATLEPIDSIAVLERQPVNQEPEEGEELCVPEHLSPLFEGSCEELSVTERARLAALLRRFSDVFSTGDGDIGRTNLTQHRIETGTAPPIRQRPRRVPLTQREVADKEVAKMLSQGVIEPSETPWSSPIVLVKKKDGSVRVCIDYRRLNEVTVKDAHPLPRIEDNLDSLAGSQFFSTLDLASGYWQVEVAEEDRPKTAFSTGRGGLYQFVTMPFGLCNAPSTFERLMERILAGLQWQVAVLYLDDVIVFGRSFGEHMQRLCLVLQRLRAANLKLKPKKCRLLQRKVEFLGHVVSPAGVATDPEKVCAVRDWPQPATVTDVRIFLGLVS